MGKGDKRTKRGKIILGTFGKSRPKNVAKAAKVAVVADAAVAKEESKEA